MLSTEPNDSPTCLYCPSQVFSDEAVKAKAQGVVTSLAVITADGRAPDIKAAKRLGFGLPVNLL